MRDHCEPGLRQEASPSMFRIAAITDEISNSFERGLELLAEWGLSEAEIHTLWDTSIENLNPEQVGHLRQLLTGFGVRACMLSSTVFLRCRIGGGTPPEPWDRRFASIGGSYADHVAALARCLEIAIELSAPLVRVFGFWPEAGDPAHARTEIVSRLREAAAQASDKGITLALENCPHSNLEKTELALDVVEAVASPRLRLLWDPSNAWRCGDRDMLALVERVMPYLAHVHLKGIRMSDELPRGHTYVPLDEGQVDYRRLLERLIEAGYQGALSLEPHYALPRSGREGAGRESFARLTQLLRGMPAAGSGPADSTIRS